MVPKYDYSCVVYNSCSTTISRKLDKFHLHALKILDLPDTPLTIPSARRKYFIAVQTFKLFHNLCPSYLENIITPAIIVIGLALRNRFRLFVPRIFTNYGKFSFYFICVKIWNSLPALILNCSTLNSFKLAYKITYNIS